MRRGIGMAVALGLAAGLALEMSPRPARSAPAEDRKAGAPRGREVYEAQRCWMCHSIAGKGNKKYPLDGVGSRLTPEQIRTWIVSPRKMKPDSKMKAFDGLSREDLDALVGYLAGLEEEGKP